MFKPSSYRDWGFYLLLIHAFLLLIYISPFSYQKAIQGLFLYGAMYLISGIMIGIIIYALIKRHFKTGLILLFLSGLLFSLDLNAYLMRQIVLEKTINWFYCPTEELEYGEEILGGLWFAGEKMGFENATQCLITVCREEYYYCHDS